MTSVIRYNHIHTRVWAVMRDANKPLTKEEIAARAFTTLNVVNNAFYDIKRGIRMPNGVKYEVPKIREFDETGKGVNKYFIGAEDNQLELPL